MEEDKFADGYVFMTLKKKKRKKNWFVRLTDKINPLSTNPTKWSNKDTIRRLLLLMICLSVFDHLWGWRDLSVTAPLISGHCFLFIPRLTLLVPIPDEEKKLT